MLFFGLYVDFVKQDDKWYEPSMSTKELAMAVNCNASLAFERVHIYFEKGLFDSDILSQLGDIYGEIMMKKDQFDSNDMSQLFELQQDIVSAHRRYFELAISLGEITPEDNLTFMGEEIEFA